MNTLSMENFSEATKITISKIKRKRKLPHNVELAMFNDNTSPSYEWILL